MNDVDGDGPVVSIVVIDRGRRSEVRVTRDGRTGREVDVVRKPIDDAIAYAAQLGVVHGLARRIESLEWLRHGEG